MLPCEEQVCDSHNVRSMGACLHIFCFKDICTHAHLLAAMVYGYMVPFEYLHCVGHNKNPDSSLTLSTCVFACYGGVSVGAYI